MTNQPYVKKYNANGEVVNPIVGSYIHQLPTRSEKRKGPDRFISNGNNYHLTIFKGHKFRRFRQHILLKDGNIKNIEHYLSR